MIREEIKEEFKKQLEEALNCSHAYYVVDKEGYICDMSFTFDKSFEGTKIWNLIVGKRGNFHY